MFKNVVKCKLIMSEISVRDQLQHPGYWQNPQFLPEASDRLHKNARHDFQAIRQAIGGILAAPEGQVDVTVVEDLETLPCEIPAGGFLKLAIDNLMVHTREKPTSVTPDDSEHFTEKTGMMGNKNLLYVGDRALADYPAGGPAVRVMRSLHYARPSLYLPGKIATIPSRAADPEFSGYALQYLGPRTRVGIVYERGHNWLEKIAIAEIISPH